MSSDEEAIRKLVDDWHRATAAGNVDAILPLMSEEVVFLVCGKPPMKGRATFEQGLRSLLTSHRIQSKRSEEHTSELQSQSNLVCRLLLEKKKKKKKKKYYSNKS